MPSIPASRLAPLALAAALALAPPLPAQERPERVDLHGRVVDRASGAAVVNAHVRLDGQRRGTATDTAGRFVLRRMRPGQHTLVVSQLGYDTATVAVSLDPASAPVELALAPDPVLLEGVKVVADRLRDRRFAAATSVRVFDRRRLLTSGAINATHFLSSYALFIPAPCMDGGFASTCAWVRGSLTPVRVFIDGRVALGGLDELNTYRPAELYMVEVHGGGRAVQAFTTWFVEQAAGSRSLPIPIF